MSREYSPTAPLLGVLAHGAKRKARQLRLIATALLLMNLSSRILGRLLGEPDWNDVGLLGIALFTAYVLLMINPYVLIPRAYEIHRDRIRTTFSMRKHDFAFTRISSISRPSSSIEKWRLRDSLKVRLNGLPILNVRYIEPESSEEFLRVTNEALSAWRARNPRR